MSEKELKAKAEAILKLKTMHDKELWASRFCVEILNPDYLPWWNWEEIGVEFEEVE